MSQILEIIENDKQLSLAYQGVPSIGQKIVINLFGSAVDSIVSKELAGEDPLRSALWALYVMYTAFQGQVDREYERLMRTVDPPQIPL